MSIFYNSRSLFSLKSLIVSVVLFLLFTLSGHFAEVNAQGGQYKLEKILVSNLLGSKAAIVKENYNSGGGYVDINADGKIYDLCPGGSEKIRYKWDFQYDVSNANPGGGINIDINAQILSRGEPCRDAIASASYLAVNGSSGGISPLPPEYAKSVDGERFANGNGVRVRAAGEKTTSGVANIQMRAHAANSQRPYAYFTVDISIRGAGSVRYIYLYRRIS